MPTGDGSSDGSNSKDADDLAVAQGRERYNQVLEQERARRENNTNGVAGSGGVSSIKEVQQWARGQAANQMLPAALFLGEEFAKQRAAMLVSTNKGLPRKLPSLS